MDEQKQLKMRGNLAINTSLIRYANLGALINNEPGVAIYWKDADYRDPTTFTGEDASDAAAIITSDSTVVTSA